MGPGHSRVQAVFDVAGEVLLRYKDDTRIHDVEIHKLPVRQHLLYKFNIRQYLLLDSVTNDVQPIELPFEEEVYPFIIDKDDNCWLGTDNGLYQLKQQVVSRLSAHVYEQFLDDDIG